jgi:hypothetical protein
MVAEGPPEPDLPAPITRRGFFARTSLASLAAFAAVARRPEVTRATSSRPQPPPCTVRCEPITRTGCACGGYLYRCRGCGAAFHACVPGRPFSWICLRRAC